MALLTRKQENKKTEELEIRLAEAEETLQAIRSGEVDALVVNGLEGDQIFTLQGAETPYRLLVEAMNEGALILSPDGTILHANERFAQWIKSPLEQVIGSFWQRFFPPDEHSQLSRMLKPTKKKGSRIESCLQADDGSLHPVQLSFNSMLGIGVQGFAAIVTDLAERKAAEKLLQAAKEDLELRVQERTRELTETNTALRAEMAERKKIGQALQAAKDQLASHAQQLEETVAERTSKLRETIDELEAFSYSLSHDMRAPLRAIQSFSQIVLAEHAENIGPQGIEYLTKVISSAERLDRLIQDVLAFSRVSRQDIKVQTLDVEKLILQIIHERSELQPPKVDIQIQRPLLPMRGHDASLTQCISNLLDNAVKFVQPGTQPQVVIRSESIGNEVRLWFEDNGIGIEKSAQDRMFGMFQRVHRGESYSGTGIGLTIVRKAVARMNGTVGVESEVGKGSRFWLQLPREIK